MGLEFVNRGWANVIAKRENIDKTSDLTCIGLSFFGEDGICRQEMSNDDGFTCSGMDVN